MKKSMKYMIPVAAALITLAGCSDFLDRNPSSGMSDETLFADYTTAQAYLDAAIWHLDRQFDIDYMNNNRSHNSQLSDECATTANAGSNGDGQYRAAFINAGNWLLTSKTSDEWEMGVNIGGKTVAGRASTSIRVCNRVLASADRIQNITPEQRDYLLGQAHMLRAWHYFEMIRRWGGMPKLDHVLTDKEDADIVRETYQGSHDWMVEDLDAAIRLLPDEWDNSNFGRPNKVAAMALREMTELYAASPLMQNGLESTTVQPYDRERAKRAAQLAQDVIDYMNSHSENYRLIGRDGDAFTREYIYWWPNRLTARNPEHLWFNRQQHAIGGTGGIRTFCLTPQGTSAQNGANSAYLPTPTLNIVNMFDKMGGDGIYYPIVDSRAGYTLENPYQDRDPRFYQFILYPGAKPYGQYAVAVRANNAYAPGYAVAAASPYYATTFVGGYDYQKFLTNQYTNIQSTMQTSFMHKKFHWEKACEASGGGMRENNCYHRTVFIRAAQIYLDFAEASFEATGSATVRVEECDLTAEEAINVVRERWGLTPLAADIVSDPAKFREAYRRERAVELFMESHRWFDIRRWMIAHEIFNPTAPVYGVDAGRFSGTSPIWGMRTELKPGQKITKPADITWDKFTYTPYPMTNVIRNFEMRNYWYPFPSLEIASQTNLKQNPGW